MRYLDSDGLAGSFAEAATNVAARVVFPSNDDDPIFTLALWLRSTPGVGTVFDLTDDGAPRFRMTYDAGDLANAFLHEADGDLVTEHEMGAGASNAWTHIVMTFSAPDGGTAWINGVNQGVNSSTGGTYVSADALRLFADYLGANRFRGHMRAPALFDRTLVAAEVASLYTAGKSHDLTQPVGSYLGDPVVLWDGPDLGGYVANRGSGGSCNLLLNGGVTVESLQAGASFVAFPTGTHSIRGIAASAFADLLPESWALSLVSTDETVVGETPRIVAVEMFDGDMRDLVLRLDAALVPGVRYEVSPPFFLENLDSVSSVEIVGPKRDLAVEASPDDRVLVDLDSPFIRETRRGGDLTINEAGDYALTSGRDTIEKAIWDLLLSPKGARYWSPDHGTDLRHKGLRALDSRETQRRLEDAIEAIPYVRKAVVQLLWDAGHMVVSVRAETDFGRIVTQGGVDQSGGGVS